MIEILNYTGNLFENLNLSNTLEYYIKASPVVGSPLVFAHMDFHRANRVIQTKNQQKEIFFLDLDTSMYSYRGFDFGAFFISYLQRDKEKFKLVSDDDMIKCIQIYREECSKIVGLEYLQDEQNSVEQILKESKFFLMYLLFIYKFFALAMYCQDTTNEKHRDFLRADIDRNDCLSMLKKQFKENGILPDVGIEIW